MFESQNLSNSKGQELNNIVDRILNDSTEARSTNDNNMLVLAKEAPQALYLRRLYQQAKQLSQIICYIWRWVDGEDNQKSNTAKKLQKYFLEPTPFQRGQNGEINLGGNLKKLLGANPRENDSNDEAAPLLRDVFPDYNQPNTRLIFPMFSKLELGDDEKARNLGYLFLVDINVFDGALEDVDSNTPTFFKFVIPYPPRPQLGEGTVTPEFLQEWVENRERNRYFPGNPYIPKTCS